MVSKVAASVIFNVNVTTFDAYAMNILMAAQVMLKLKML